jgi:hypothetical protein
MKDVKCPKCDRIWPFVSEQSACIEIHGACIVCHNDILQKKDIQKAIKDGDGFDFPQIQKIVKERQKIADAEDSQTPRQAINQAYTKAQFRLKTEVGPIISEITKEFEAATGYALQDVGFEFTEGEVNYTWLSADDRWPGKEG